MSKARKKKILRDAVIIVASVIIAFLIMKSDVIEYFVLQQDGWYVLNSFVAGLFFTSIFTTAPAIAFLAKLGSLYPPIVVALVGGAGAVIGDLILFYFLKDHLTDDVRGLLFHSKSRRMRKVFSYPFIKWSLAFLGALIIASPLPDELGLALMGFSKIELGKLIMISYAFNTLGIFIIATIASRV